MRNIDVPNKISEINRLAQGAPSELINVCEQYYHGQIDSIADMILNGSGHRIIMLSGPSSAGKTTTAHKLIDRLKNEGVGAVVISLDDFYKGRDLAPLLPDGTHDYESVDALDIDELSRCLNSLCAIGQCYMPHFDFSTGMPSLEKTELAIDDDDVILVEGIHAMNPEVVRYLPSDNLLKLFIQLGSDVYNDDGSVLISSREMRLVRRLVRDHSHRSSTAENTLRLWKQVVASENINLFPFADAADVEILSFHSYEMCMLAGRLMSVCEDISPQSPYYSEAQALLSAADKFEPMPLDYLPEDSLLCEFLK